MIQLAWRFFAKSWRIQVAITCLFAVSVALLIIYGTYLQREVTLLEVRMEGELQDNFIRVELNTSQSGPSKLRRYRGPGPVPVQYLGSWQTGVVNTSHGRLPVAMVTQDEGLNLGITSAEVLIPQTLATLHNLALGDKLVIITAGEYTQFTIAQVHDGTLYGQRLVIWDKNAAVSNVFLFRHESNALSAAVAYLRRTYAEGVFAYSGSTRSAAQEVIDAVYSPGIRARLGVILFISLAFLTVTLFSFLAKRRALAIVKSLGLRTWEMVALLSYEAVLPPLFGSLLGCGLAFVTLRWMISAGQQFIIDGSVFANAALSIWPAVALGIAIPARFTQVATVNQLLFERPVPIQTVIVKELGKRISALDVFTSQGTEFIHLQMEYGYFNGSVFRRLGDYVKQGEVIAVEERWWGLQVVEYHAPITGCITYFQDELGLVGVSPDSNSKLPPLQFDARCGNT